MQPQTPEPNVGHMTTETIEVQLVQVNYRYGNNVFLPYSIGCLEAAVRADRKLACHVKFRPLIFERHPINQVVSGLIGVDVLGLSAYIWNWEYVKQLGAKFRSTNPKALIVVGGPQVSAQDADVFRSELWFADAVVLGEGELTFVEILKARLQQKDLGQITGLLVPDVHNDRAVISTGDAVRVEDLSKLPSPYVEGIFDDLIDVHKDLEFQASQETHRGCPYACTFCDWGSATMSRVRRFPFDRIVAEYEWMGTQAIDLLYNCDANYGLFKEDVELTRQLVQTNQKYGYPKKFRAAYAKNSNQRVFHIAKLLNDSDMCKGVTLSLQSTDADVLTLIKRKNMQINKFAELVSTYRKERIPTYTELIIGLPGESVTSFLAGLNEMLEAGQHDSLNIYHAMVLPNAELNAPAYRELHGIRSVKTPLLLLHGTDADAIQEYNEIVIQTNTMSNEDWVLLTTISYVVQAFHCLNITKKIAIALNRLCNVPYIDFYRKLISWSLANHDGPGKTIEQVKDMCLNVSNGIGSLDIQERRFGDLVWPTEEALFLGMILRDNRQWLKDFLISTFGEQLPPRCLRDLVEFQHLSTVYPRLDTPAQDQVRTFENDWISITEATLRDSSANKSLNQTIRTRWIMGRNEWNSLEEYAREVVWYGRKGTAIENEVQQVLG